MRCYAVWVGILGGVLALAGGGFADRPAPPESCGDHGTAVSFVASPKDAAKKAEQEQKLVFVLHVSGHFEDPTFT